MRCPVPTGACAYADVFFFCQLLIFVFVSLLDSIGQLLSAHETHIQYPLLTQFCSTNDSVGWLPVDHHLVVLLQRPQQYHVLLQCPVLLQYALLQHTIEQI